MSDEIKPTYVSRPPLLDGLLTRQQLELETGWHKRTVRRREVDGLPVIVIGSTKLYPANEVRGWILSKGRDHKTPLSSQPEKAA